MSDQIQHFQNKLAFEIDSWDLKVALEAGEPVVVIDARAPKAFTLGHIPGAINIPHRHMSLATTAGISPSALVVTYCDGIGCNASTKGALAMSQLGFRVKELMGGLDWWKRDGYAVVSE
jgi:rhodanese-related sulfurtransferase